MGYIIAWFLSNMTCHHASVASLMIRTDFERFLFFFYFFLIGIKSWVECNYIQLACFAERTNFGIRFQMWYHGVNSPIILWYAWLCMTLLLRLSVSDFEEIMPNKILDDEKKTANLHNRQSWTQSILSPIHFPVWSCSYQMCHSIQNETNTNPCPNFHRGLVKVPLLSGYAWVIPSLLNSGYNYLSVS